MILENLFLQNFRNFKDFSLQIDQRKQLHIFGLNGTGKTNLLEAIYILFTSRSFRNRKSLRDCVKTGEPYFHLQADINAQRSGMTFSINDMEKSFMLQQERVKSLEFVRGKNILYFSPDETQIFFQSQEIRRALLDRYLSALRKPYLQKLLNFSTLRQKKLQILLSKTTRKRSLLDLDSQAFRVISNEISDDRGWFIDRLNPLFQEYLERLNPKLKNSQMKYRKRQIPDNYLEKELAQERILYGCHKEELDFLEHGKDVRSTFSNGEKKVVNLALHFSFMELLRQEAGLQCLICLDDIESELDSNTLQNIQEVLDQSESQVIVTSKMIHRASDRDILLTT